MIHPVAAQEPQTGQGNRALEIPISLLALEEEPGVPSPSLSACTYSYLKLGEMSFTLSVYMPEQDEKIQVILFASSLPKTDGFNLLSRTLNRYLKSTCYSCLQVTGA